MPILFPSITLGYSGAELFYQLYLYFFIVTSWWSSTLKLVCLFLLTFIFFHWFDHLWPTVLLVFFCETMLLLCCFTLQSYLYFQLQISSCTFMFHSKVFSVSFRSTWPWPDGFLGALCTNFILWVWQRFSMFLFLNSPPVSKRSFLGKPTCKTVSLIQQSLEDFVCLWEISSTNTLKSGQINEEAVCVFSLHLHSKLLKSIKSTSTWFMKYLPELDG